MKERDAPVCKKCGNDHDESNIDSRYCSWYCEHLDNLGMIAATIRSLFGMGCDGSQCFSYLKDKGYLYEMSDSTVGRFKRVLLGE